MEKRIKYKKIGYWTLTGAFCLAMLASGITSLTHSPSVVAGMSHLGYPLYFSNILGISKILGVLALATNKFPKLKEWAYAGFTFDVIGAIASLLYVGDVKESIFAFVFLGALALSYWLWTDQMKSQHKGHHS